MRQRLFALALLIFSSTAAASIQMAITVDDLPIHGSLPANTSRLAIANSMLASLQLFHVPQVYGFINSAKLSQDKDGLDVLKSWVKAGYPLGNHTFNHINLNRASADAFIKEVLANEETLKRLDPKSDWHYFRYPFLHEGDTLEKRNAVRKQLKSAGYKLAPVTDDFEDWAWNETYARCKSKSDLTAIEKLRASYLEAAKRCFTRDQKMLQVLYQHPVRRILLLHIGAFDAEMLPALLKMYTDLGVEFIPLSEAVNDPIYKTDPGVAGGGDDWEFMEMKSRHLSRLAMGLKDTWRYPREELAHICIH